ncbi:MAG: hypothetical protein SFU25_06285 [Candidatus Caenarcaniphilales bacterium]|nr:hypothetical protein [Candidatus Caenarcaniphilales bacterium]
MSEDQPPVQPEEQPKTSKFPLISVIWVTSFGLIAGGGFVSQILNPLPPQPVEPSQTEASSSPSSDQGTQPPLAPNPPVNTQDLNLEPFTDNNTQTQINNPTLSSPPPPTPSSSSPPPPQVETCTAEQDIAVRSEARYTPHGANDDTYLGQITAGNSLQVDPSPRVDPKSGIRFYRLKEVPDGMKLTNGQPYTGKEAYVAANLCLIVNPQSMNRSPLTPTGTATRPLIWKAGLGIRVA